MIGTPNDVVFIAAGSPYRISYPAAIGDECLTLRFSSEALAQMLPRAVPRHGCSPAFASHVLLPPQVMLTRGLLWQCGGGKPRDPLEIEELGVDVLVAAMSALCLDDRVARRGKRSYGTTSTARRIAWCWPISRLILGISHLERSVHPWRSEHRADISARFIRTWWAV